MPFGISGAVSSSQSSSSQDVFAADVFRRLFAGAGNVAGEIDTAGLTGAANRLFSGGTGFLSDLQSVSAGDDVSGRFLSERISGGGFADENIAALSEDLGQFFNEELLPGISSGAQVAGQLGGGRQGVAEGKAVESVGREFRRGAVDIRNRDLRERTEAAGQLAGQRLSASTAGLTGVQQQFDLAHATTLAPFSPFLTLAQILGRPTTLTESQSSAESESLGFSIGG